MNRSSRRVELTDALLIGYFSVVAYLLTMAKEFAYLSFYEIPSYFVNVSILDSARNLLITVLVLLATYILYKYLVDRTSKDFYSEIKSVKWTSSLLFLLFFVRITFSAFIPLLFYFIADGSIYWTIRYFIYTFCIFSSVCIIEQQLRKTMGLLNHKIISQGSFHVIWIISNFILFWSAGLMFAKGNQRFLTIDSGKTAVIYIGGGKIFVSPIIGNTVSNTNGFSTLSIEDSNYHFSTIILQR